MSLLDDGPDTVTVYPEKIVTDSLGNEGKRVPDLDNPFVLEGVRVQPTSSIELLQDGQRVVTNYSFRVREFPAGAFAKATWDGRDWDVVAEPARRNGSSTTRHVTVSLKARKAKAVT